MTLFSERKERKRKGTKSESYIKQLNLQPDNIPGYFNVELLRMGRRELEERDQTELRRCIKVGVPTVGQESATDFFF